MYIRRTLGAEGLRPPLDKHMPPTMHLAENQQPRPVGHLRPLFIQAELHLSRMIDP